MALRRPRPDRTSPPIQRMTHLVAATGRDPDAIRTRLGYAAWEDAPAETIARLTQKALHALAERRRDAEQMRHGEWGRGLVRVAGWCRLAGIDPSAFLVDHGLADWSDVGEGRLAELLRDAQCRALRQSADGQVAGLAA